MRDRSKREDRRSDFDFFRRDAKKVIGDIAAADPRHDFMERTYSFYVVPGGRFGGYDDRTVEVFYGQRPFDKVREPEPGGPPFSLPRTRLLAERGATLLYQRGDPGIVVCTLHPAGSENFHRREEGIVLAVIAGTHALTGKGLPERHWRAFMSYMQYTSLDGEPTLGDRLRVWWLLFTRRLIVKGEAMTPRWLTATGQLAFYTATVGLSGTLLAIIQWLLSSPAAACACR